MQENYYKRCVEKNEFYSVYYGEGVFCSTDHVSVLHNDSDITITYFKQCRADILVEGRRYAVKSGDVVLINPKEVHCCVVQDGSFHERISLFVNRSIVSQFPYKCEELFDCFYNRRNDDGNLIPAEIAENCSIQSLMDTILSLAKEKSEKNRILCTCKIIELLTQLNVAAYLPRPSAENQTVTHAIEYIRAHFVENITCRQIAESVFISRFRLEHLFKESVGVSLWDYVILRRLLFVNESIQQGKAIKEAAFAAGFRNYSNFYRLYKKHMGCTPMDYKQQKVSKTPPLVL